MSDTLDNTHLDFEDEELHLDEYVQGSGGNIVNAHAEQHEAGGSDPIDLSAGAVTVTPAGEMSSTDAQSALEEIQTDATQALSDAEDAQNDATQALSDSSTALSTANNAQADATQAISDASSAQSDVDSALALDAGFSATEVEIQNDGGGSAVITSATESLAGVLPALDKLKLNQCELIVDAGGTDVHYLLFGPTGQTRSGFVLDEDDANTRITIFDATNTPKYSFPYDGDFNLYDEANAQYLLYWAEGDGFLLPLQNDEASSSDIRANDNRVIVSGHLEKHVGLKKSILYDFYKNEDWLFQTVGNAIAVQSQSGYSEANHQSVCRLALRDGSLGAQVATVLLSSNYRNNTTDRGTFEFLFKTPSRALSSWCWDNDTTGSYSGDGASTVTITANGHNLGDGDIVNIASSTLSAGLLPNTYVVANATANTFDVADANNGTTGECFFFSSDAGDCIYQILAGFTDNANSSTENSIDDLIAVRYGYSPMHIAPIKNAEGVCRDADVESTVSLDTSALVADTWYKFVVEWQGSSCRFWVEDPTNTVVGQLGTVSTNVPADKDLEFFIAIRSEEYGTAGVAVNLKVDQTSINWTN